MGTWFFSSGARISSSILSCSFVRGIIDCQLFEHLFNLISLLCVVLLLITVIGIDLLVPFLLYLVLFIVNLILRVWGHFEILAHVDALTNFF